ncbi:hypothetical protein CYMTET_35102 [Cymbomonas tetramitiformis]|uniref:Uncharacterized protein n=1 Tax=Cymbomonas tetramitiformis TaxID=36881 RepID=A0AAE0F9T2_9CHLO|nr:hypothetical protein CYMTET_35102 [Cymbomonas tetramitiformis]
MQAMNASFMKSTPVQVSRASPVARAQPLRVVAAKKGTKVVSKKAAPAESSGGFFGFKFDWVMKDVFADGIGTETESSGFKSEWADYASELRKGGKYDYIKKMKDAGAEYTVNYQPELLEGKSREKMDKPFKKKYNK